MSQTDHWLLYIGIKLLTAVQQRSIVRHAPEGISAVDVGSFYCIGSSYAVSFIRLLATEITIG